MPTTLTGLLLFVVLLLPGFAYLVGKERNGTERKTSPFRETVAIVAASVTSEIAVLVLFAIVRGLWPSVTPDVGALIRHGGVYLHGSDAVAGHYGQVAIWATGMLTLAVILAYAATAPLVRRRRKWLPFIGPYPHNSTVSAWWILFQTWKAEREATLGRDVEVQVTCILDDGSAVRGRLGSFNISADDSPDRDLILRKPISYRPVGDDQMHDHSARAMCVPGSRIVTMFVSYIDPSAQTITSSEAAGLPAGGQTLPPPAALDPAQAAASGP
jgi:hypothetical protein